MGGTSLFHSQKVRFLNLSPNFQTLTFDCWLRMWPTRASPVAVQASVGGPRRLVELERGRGRDAGLAVLIKVIVYYQIQMNDAHAKLDLVHQVFKDHEQVKWDY